MITFIYFIYFEAKCLADTCFTYIKVIVIAHFVKWSQSVSDSEKNWDSVQHDGNFLGLHLFGTGIPNIVHWMHNDHQQSS